MKIIAIIPARSGSKGIINKNIKNYKGLPLMVHSIKLAQNCKLINNVIVSTDSQIYAELAIKYNAYVPYYRPPAISEDLSTDYEFMKYHCDWCIKHNKKVPDIIVHLRPTYPNRKLDDLNKCLKLFIDNYDNYDSLRTVVKFDKSPYKMYTIENNNLCPLFKSKYELYNQCRQNLPDTYLHNGSIDIVKTTVIMKNKSISGDRIYPYVMNDNETNDIDTIDDWNKSIKNI